MASESLCNPKEAAELLRCSIPTLNKHVRNGLFNKYYFPNSRRVYFKKKEILDSLVVKEYDKANSSTEILNCLKQVKAKQKSEIIDLLNRS